MAQREVPSVYQAVVNHEGHYSMWPEPSPIPDGWQLAGKSGSREEVLAWIAEMWPQIRPNNGR